MANKNVAQRQQKRTRPSNHTFHGCRDVIVNGSSGVPTSTPAYVTTTSGGAYAYSWCLAPLGLGAAVYGSSAYQQAVAGNVASPYLRGLYNRALDFQWYRVTRAKLVFVGQVGSTSTGSITLSGYSDPSDASLVTNINNVSLGSSTKAFDLASASTKELSVSIPVDTTWKKVSWTLSEPAGIAPYTGSSVGVIVPVSTVGDLSFGAVSVSVVGAAATVSLGTLYIDYDVEFKGPIDSAVNF